MTQQNATASEELASTAEELAAQAEALHALMGFFHVEAMGFSPGKPREPPPAQRAPPRRPASKLRGATASSPRAFDDDADFERFTDGRGA